MYKCLLFALFVVATVSSGQADSSPIPRCISGMCFGSSLSDFPTEKQVRKLIGSNKESKPSVPHRRSSCYIISTPKHKEVYANLSFIRFASEWRLISITVGSQRLCNNAESLTVDYEFLTEKGIGLGSRKEDVVAAYGKPKYLLDSPSIDLLESYFPDAINTSAYTIAQYVSDGEHLLTARFFLFKGLVIGIDLSADE